MLKLANSGNVLPFIFNDAKMLLPLLIYRIAPPLHHKHSSTYKIYIKNPLTMNLKKVVLAMVSAFFGIILNAQGLLETTATDRKVQYHLPHEIYSQDFSKSPDATIHLQSNKSMVKADNGWYPKRGEYYITSETEVAGHIYIEINEDGLLDKQILVCNRSGLYDSTVMVMNRTPYSKLNNLSDTSYNYNKNPDGTYVLAKRVTQSYHYFDHIENDSLFYEQTAQYWDDSNKQWLNYHKVRIGYHDTLVQYHNRTTEWASGADGTWVPFLHWRDSISYNMDGFVDSLYHFKDNECIYKVAFTNNEDGSYTQAKHILPQEDTWNEVGISYDITWTEWNGFMFGREVVLGGELSTPYKRTKINSQYDQNYSSPEKSFYKKLWNIDGTLSNNDGQYVVLGDNLYPADAIENYYNEYGDYVMWRNQAWALPDENGNQKCIHYRAVYYEYTYDEAYGRTGYMLYDIDLKHDKIDTVFNSGIKYTDFEYYEVSIPEHKKIANEALVIAPNPASGTVNISASEDIKQLNIYSVSGKLVNKQYPASKDVTFNAGALHKGIYSVQAVLKTGKIQMGKLVVK